ncbi:hypothetical protein FRX31_031632 [Thalictrum thalictroides]|uniref:RING-type domain-containing protein n=1 Tax=Thalictrum thalictroides TaxID=46969 RepID=A0A7J6V1D7_THATH|nr:hypothetical protein FRX31_031632 [Thalictrum thalictroides]
METFLDQITPLAPAMTKSTLNGFFGTIKTKLQQNLIDENYVSSQGNICSDLKMRVINQLLSYNYEHMDLDNEQVKGEVPNVSEIRLRWMDKLATFVKSQLQGGEMLEMSSVKEELQNLLTPMQNAWHGCYHCHVFFKRNDVHSSCPRCDGWLLVEVDGGDDDEHKFMYGWEEVVPFERRRLIGPFKVSARNSIQEFEMVDNNEDEECPSCKQKSDQHVDDGWRLTPCCQHIIGYSCLEDWLDDGESSNCPVCRSEFPVDIIDGPLAELFNRSRRIRLDL